MIGFHGKLGPTLLAKHVFDTTNIKLLVSPSECTY